MGICRENGLEFYDGKQEYLPEYFDVFFQHHSEFNLGRIGAPFRGLHIIRDPRDVIVSGCFYHQKSDEAWLHIPQQRFQGMTYQQKICSYSRRSDQVLFEMEQCGRRTIESMTKWDYTQTRFYEVKYEHLVQDENLDLFRKIFTFLGFPAGCMPGVLQHASDNSLFSGRLQKSLHIRSGRPQQWKQFFTPDHKKRFLELFADALVTLGYETDNDWSVDQASGADPEDQ